MYIIAPSLEAYNVTYTLLQTGTTGVADMVPAGLTWAVVSADVAAFIANPFVLSVVSAILAILLVPKFLRLLKRIAR